MVSIIIPAYKADFFEIALKSAINQTWKDLEIVICDDSPNGEIAAISEKFSSDRRIKYFKNEKNLGDAKNLNRAFELAKGKYIKPLNDDDILMPDCVEKLLKMLEDNSDCVLATSKRNRVGERSQPLDDSIETSPIAITKCVFHGRDIINTCLKLVRNFIGEPSVVMFPRKAIENHREPNIYTYCHYDYEGHFIDLPMWAKMLSRGNLIYTPEPLSIFRLHFNTITGSKERFIKLISTWYYLDRDARFAGFLLDDGDFSTAVRNLTKVYMTTLENATLGKMEMDQKEQDNLLNYIKLLEELYESNIHI